MKRNNKLIKKVLSIGITMFLFMSIFYFKDVNVTAATSKTIVVAKDGSGNFKTVQAAVNSIPKNNKQRVNIYIKNGTYKEKVRISQNLVSFKG